MAAAPWCALPAARARAADDATTIVVGFAAGGVIDALARTLAPRMSEALAMPVIVENRTGAGGRIAVGNVIAAPPNGRVLLLTPGAMITLQPHVIRDLPYDPLTQLAPVAMIGSSNLAIVVAAPSPARDLDELLRRFRREPASASCGSPGAGSVAHFAMLDLARRAGVEVTVVHYRSALQVVEALLEGSLAAAPVVPSLVAPYIAAGKLRALATTGPARDPRLPATPTLRESGIDAVVREWAGVFAPAGTPAPTVAAVATATESAVRRIADSKVDYGVEAEGIGPSRFSALVGAEYRRWGEIVRVTGVKVES